MDFFCFSSDGESSLQEHSCGREGDADLLYLHGQEQQESLGPESRWRQTAGLNSTRSSYSHSDRQTGIANSSRNQNRLFLQLCIHPTPPVRPEHEPLLSSEDIKHDCRRSGGGMNSPQPVSAPSHQCSLMSSHWLLPFDLALQDVFSSFKQGPWELSRTGTLCSFTLSYCNESVYMYKKMASKLK